MGWTGGRRSADRCVESPSAGHFGAGSSRTPNEKWLVQSGIRNGLARTVAITYAAGFWLPGGVVKPPNMPRRPALPGVDSVKLGLAC